MFLLISASNLAQKVADNANSISSLKFTIEIFTSVVVAALLGSGIGISYQSYLNHKTKKEMQVAIMNVTAKTAQPNRALSILSECIAAQVGGREYATGIHMNWKDTLEAYQVVKINIPHEKKIYLRYLKNQVAFDFLEDYDIPIDTNLTEQDFVGGYKIIISIDFNGLEDEFAKSKTIKDKLLANKELYDFKKFWENS